MFGACLRGVLLFGVVLFVGFCYLFFFRCGAFTLVSLGETVR